MEKEKEMDDSERKRDGGLKEREMVDSEREIDR